MQNNAGKIINLFWPHINKKRIMQELSATFDTRWIGQGPKCDLFEQQFGNYLGVVWSAIAGFKVNAVAVNSGTAALHLAYILAGVKEGDEVITTPMTCTATNHPILWLRAKPVFADIQKDTLNIDPFDIERKITKKTKAIVVMHNGGCPCDMKWIMKLAREHNLKVIEDCAQALGATIDNQKVGTFADYGIFSFQAIKHITTGDGGMLICKDDEDAKRAKRLRWFGIDREKKIQASWHPFLQRAMTFDVDETGYKYQMTDIDATLGLVGLEDIDRVLEIRCGFASIYRKELDNLKKVSLLKDHPGHAYWLFQILVDDRDAFQEFMSNKGIETNIVQVRNEIYKVFGGKKWDLPNLNSIEDNYVSIPLHPRLSAEDIYKVIESIKEYEKS